MATIPPTTHLTYLAEGAANVIYRISLPPTTATEHGLSPDVSRTHLLRLRKALPSATPNLPAFTSLRTTFFPLFPQHLILDTRIVEIPAALIERENAILRKREEEGRRSEKRARLYLVGPPPASEMLQQQTEEPAVGGAYERYGFLVEDMSPRPPSSAGTPREVLVEFKPKWVLQSPGAPRGWRRCRTCALRVMKEVEKSGTDVPGNGTAEIGSSHWCPLDLASGEHARVRRAVRGILERKGAATTGWGAKSLEDEEAATLAEKVAGYFMRPRGRELFALLRKYQGEWDRFGVENVFGEGNVGEVGDAGERAEKVKMFLKAMTCRDLSLFVKVDVSKPSPGTLTEDDPSVRVCIGDLDPKSPTNKKAAYWISLEQTLRSGGWYAGTEKQVREGTSPEGAHGKQGGDLCWCYV